MERSVSETIEVQFISSLTIIAEFNPSVRWNGVIFIPSLYTRFAFEDQRLWSSFPIRSYTLYQSNQNPIAWLNQR
jgi:hypothetical protein